MFAKFVGRRVTAVATALAVVVGLAITPAFTATAAEGDEPVIIPQATEVVAEETPPVEPAPPVVEPLVVEPPAEESPVVEQLVVEAPAEEKPAEQPPAEQKSEPVVASTPTTTQSMMRSSAPEVSTFGYFDAPTILTDSITPVVVGQTLHQQLEADYPISWYTWFPTTLGLWVSPEGVAQGTLDRAGEFELTAVAWNFGGSDEKTYSVTVKPEITTPPLPGATVKEYYEQSLDSTRGKGQKASYSYTGDLPPGFKLTNNGKIKGTVNALPSNSEIYAFSVTARVNGVDSVAKDFSITVGYPTPTVTTSSLPIAAVGTLYPATQLVASGGGTMTWSASGLPAGIVLDASTGILSGSPAYNSGYGTSTTLPITVTVNNGSDSAPQTLSLTVTTPAPVLDAVILPDATIGALYDEQLTVTDGHGVLTYELTDGSLPIGVVLQTDGRLYGTPTYDPTAGATKTIEFTVKVTGTAGTDEHEYSFSLHTSAPAITTTTLPEGWWKQAYNQPVIATGPGITVTVDDLPNGLVFNGTHITGSTKFTGDHSLTITASNTAGVAKSTVTLTINNKPELFWMPAFKVQTGDSFTLFPDFDGEGVTLTLGADAPVDMKLNRNNRVKWTPTTPGVYKFTITATNLAGTDSRKYTIRVFDAPVLTHGALDQGVINMPYKQKLQHDGTNVKFTVVRGDLPDGLKLTKKGIIKGSATEAGSFSFKVRAKNAVGVHSVWFNLTVLAPGMTLSSTSIIQGKSLTVNGAGYLPGDKLELWLHSTPVLLGTVTATNGTFTSTVTIPANTPAGAHHLVVTGAQSGTQSVPLTITTPPAPPAPPASPQQPRATTQSQSPVLTVTPSDETTVVDDSDESDDSEVEENEADEDLPTLPEPQADDETAAVTPVNWSGFVVAAFALLLAALALWFIFWRRRRARES